MAEEGSERGEDITEMEGEFYATSEEPRSWGRQNVTPASAGGLSEGDEGGGETYRASVQRASIQKDRLGKEMTSESEVYSETGDETDADVPKRPETDTFRARDFEKEGPGQDNKYILENVIGPILKNIHSSADKDYIMNNIINKMINLAAGSPEYEVISDLLDDLLKNICEEEAESSGLEEEEEEYTNEYLHYLIDMYCIPHRKERFNLTFEFLESCLHRLTDKRKELLLRGNDMMLYIHRRIGDSDLKIICDFVKSRADVVTLDLAYNSITDFGMQIIADLLEETPTLQRLNVMNNNFGPNGMSEIGRLANTLYLDTLRVSGNELGVEGGYQVAKLLRAKNHLQYLDVAQTSQRTESLMDHIDAMYTNKTLLYLNLSRPLGEPMIGFDSGHWADAIGKMLELNSTLRELYLQKCNFICHDMERLMLCMKRNRTLYLLDFTANNVGDHGAFVLAEYLETRPALIVLLLAHNNIGDEGARALCYGIPNSRLQLLDVSYNRITDQGVMKLITTLKKPTTLRGLYLWGNTITHRTCQILRRILRADVLEPDGIDLRIYTVDRVDYVAYYPADRYNITYYCVPRVRFDLFHYPSKRRPPAPPDVGRTCPRLPYQWRVEPLDLRCPDTGPHARICVHPRHCWWPRKPLPPGADPEFMITERKKRTYREPRFYLDEMGNVIERGVTVEAPAPKTHLSSFAKHEMYSADQSAKPESYDVSLLEKDITRDEILSGEPFKERRMIEDHLDETEPRPSQTVEDETEKVLESEKAGRKPLDTRGELYEGPEGEEFEDGEQKGQGDEREGGGGKMGEENADGGDKKESARPESPDGPGNVNEQ